MKILELIGANPLTTNPFAPIFLIVSAFAAYAIVSSTITLWSNSDLPDFTD